MKLSGIVVPTLTPMDGRGEHLNLEAVPPLVDLLVEGGMQALFVNGTTGEGPLLDLDERQRHVEAVVRAVGGRVPVVVHVGAVTTAESVAHAAHAAVAGADAVACVTPYFFGYTEAELERHFRAVARAAAGVDVYLYAIPARTGLRISEVLLERLAREPNVVGIKDSTGDAEQLRRYLRVPGVTVLCGNDTLALTALEAGAAGTVSGPANVLPELYGAFWRARAAGDRDAARRWHGVIVRCLDVSGYGRRLGILKALAALRVPGLGAVRPPLAGPEPDELTAIRRTLYATLREGGLPEPAYAWLG